MNIIDTKHFCKLSYLLTLKNQVGHFCLPMLPNKALIWQQGEVKVPHLVFSKTANALIFKFGKKVAHEKYFKKYGRNCHDHVTILLRSSLLHENSIRLMYVKGGTLQKAPKRNMSFQFCFHQCVTKRFPLPLSMPNRNNRRKKYLIHKGMCQL